MTTSTSQPVPSPLSSTPGGQHFDDTLGAILIAEIIAAVLFGATSVQTYMYFNRNPRDSVIMKRTIYFLWVTDALHLILVSHGIYNYAVTNFTNPLALSDCPWSFAIEMPIAYLDEAIVTVVFAHRIQKLSGKIWPFVFVIPLTLVSFGGSLAICILAFKYPPYAEFQARYAWIWHMTFGVQAFADCVIAISLCTLLIRRRTGFKRTDHLIRDLVLYSISTCALTSSVGVACVFSYAFMSYNFVFIALAIVLPKLMLNALLALLNSRDALRDRYAAKSSVSIHLSRLFQRNTLDGGHVVRPLAQAEKNQELDMAVRIPEAVSDRDSESQASRTLDV